MDRHGKLVSRVWSGLLAVTLVGLVVRALPVWLTDFPVNDGGLFMAT